MIGRTVRFIIESKAKRRKQLFLQKFNSDWLNSISNGVNFNVVSFSGSNQYAEQLYSIASFYRNVGKPHSWIIYNDNSYRPEELAVLRSISGITICDIDLQTLFLPKWCFEQYPTLVKVEILLKLSDFGRPVIFTDSDILFYKNFKIFSEKFVSSNWYIVDEGKGYFDPEFELPSGHYPLNFGFLVLNKPADWNIVFDYLFKKIKNKKLNYWSDQTAVHILAQREKFKVMPIDKFIVNGKDSFKLSHSVNYNKIALRHFVGPVRHKMWQYSWKKILGV